MTEALARAGGPLACAGLACLYLAPNRAWRLAALGGVVLGALLLAPLVAPEEHRVAVAGAAILGLVLAALLAAALARQPWLLAVGTLASVPVRVSVHAGSTSASLFVPVFVLAGAATIVLTRDALRGYGRMRELGPLAAPLAGFVLWSGVSLLWSRDVHDGSVELLCFYVPFGIVAPAIARLEPRRLALRVLYGQIVVMAVAFASLGLYQYATRDLVWRPSALGGDAPFYRAHSVFFDPSAYGRFLVVAILATLVLALDRLTGRAFAAAAAVALVLSAGLVVSLSESSLVALAAGVLVALAVTLRRRAVVPVAVAAAALAGAVGAASGFYKPRTAFEHSTGDRAHLLANGLRLVGDHPAAGVGIGAFRREYRARYDLGTRLPKRGALHDTPVGVAAETGVVGLALLAAVWVAAWAPLRLRSAASRIVGVSVVAIAVHSLFFDTFFEDPLVWGLLGLSAMLVRSEARA